MSAPTTLVIQMQHVITLLDPTSVLVRKDLLEMVVTAQVWNANVSMEGNLTHFVLSPSSYSLLLLLSFPLIPQYCYTRNFLLLDLLPLLLLQFLSSLLLLIISSSLYCYYSYLYTNRTFGTVFFTILLLLYLVFVELRFFFSKGISIVPLIRNSNY